jgi:single-strand DNA-binding protein
MPSVNKCILIGSLGQDPVLRQSEGKKAVCNLRLAVNERGKDGPETVWISVVAFDRVAENCAAYLHKGSSVYVEGRLRPGREYKDKNGVLTKAWEVAAGTVQFIGRPPGKPGAQADPSDDVAW